MNGNDRNTPVYSMVVTINDCDFVSSVIQSLP